MSKNEIQNEVFAPANEQAGTPAQSAVTYATGEYDDLGNPKLDTKELSGERALATSRAPEGLAWQQANPEAAMRLRYRPGDMRESLGYRIGNSVREFAEDKDPSVFGKILNAGPLGGLALGTGVGALGGGLAGYVKKWITGEGSPGLWAAIGGAGGGALGTLMSYLRQQPDMEQPTQPDYNQMLQQMQEAKQPIFAGAGMGAAEAALRPLLKGASTKSSRSKTLPLQKRAAMFHDPRNFILEKLQGASDVDYSLKAKLAAAVRNMDYNTAQRLADAVRAAVGFGIGALISKFVFGSSGLGTIAGGIAGVIGTTLFRQLTKPTQPKFNFEPRPLTYTNW